MKYITIIDTFGFFFRSYYALPPLKSKDGFPTGLLTGFVNFIDTLRRDHNTEYLLFALDSPGPSFRNEIYPEYKANRPSPPEELKMQLEVAIEWVERMGFANLSKEHYEADDVIATVARIAKQRGLGVRIVSHDKDLYQLIDDGRIVLVDAVKRTIVDEEACLEKFEVHPKDFVDFQALLGDSSDNVPGVKGIGKKTAAKLINTFHTLENIYANIEQAGTLRIQKLLLEGKKQSFLSRELVRLKDDIFEDIELEKFRFDEQKNYLTCLVDDFVKFDMRNALKKAEVKNEEEIACDLKLQEEPTLTFDAITLESKEKLFEVIDRIEEGSVVAFDTETTSLDALKADLVGFSFCLDEKEAYYVPIAHNYLGVGEQVSKEDALEAIKHLFEKGNIVGQNLKFDLSVLYEHGLNRSKPFADTMIMAWLLDPGSRVGLDHLAQKYLNYEMKSFSGTVKKGEDFSSVPIEEAAFYAAEDAWMTFLLYRILLKHFELASINRLLLYAKEVEYPFINVLIDMEKHGIKVDIAHLQTLQTELSERIDQLSQEIYELAGSEFNIKSTQQLGIILFQKLGLKGAKKTKTGYSTNEAILRSLLGEHPIIEKILEYRGVQKMLSTYVKPLLTLALSDTHHRIHTSFLQTGTATGRLSSRDPNLQNIPVRSELGRKVRSAFVAKGGYKLISIDYSQIELRLLAHFSGDKALKEAFLNDEDIHMTTAIKLFGKEEAAKKRNFAKSINFGLLYGMGARKLSQELGISQAEAKEIIEAYFAAFPTVKHYLAAIEDQVKQRGYVETLLQRRRIFDYENANERMRAAYLREGVNTVFQGSAADLIKLAMLRIDEAIKNEQPDASMLLQIHDELLFEIEQSKAQEVAHQFAQIMENIYALDIPLKCSVAIGDDWGELK